MKKLLVILVVLALTVISSLVFAADVTVNGSLDIRSRSFKNLDFSDDTADTSSTAAKDTQSRERIEVNAKVGDTKGKITIENDWDSWGRFEQPMGDGTTSTSYKAADYATTGNPGKASLEVREAWIDFRLPGLPVGVKAGHQLLQLGQGWFFRSMKYGADAWMAYSPMGDNTLAFVDVKVVENNTSQADDADAYVILDSYKLNDNNTVGIDVTMVNDRRGLLLKALSLGGATSTKGSLTNVGLNYTGKVGPVNLKAEVDIQSGKVTNGLDATTDIKFSGNQIVLQASMPMDALTINATLARGSGDKADTADKNEGIVALLDADPHYTFLYEYKTKAGGSQYNLGKGFDNTTALGIGAAYALKSVTVGADVWMLKATEKVDDKTSSNPAVTTNDLGTEIDVKVNWTLAENLTWNWTLGYLVPGNGLGKDTASGVQGVLSMKF